MNSRNLTTIYYTELLFTALITEELDVSTLCYTYSMVRNDIDFFSTLSWNYLVLDEGHVIKNTKSKTTMAIREGTRDVLFILFFAIYASVLSVNYF